jgi:hypothetical protein
MPGRRATPVTHRSDQGFSRTRLGSTPSWTHPPGWASSRRTTRCRLGSPDHAGDLHRPPVPVRGLRPGFGHRRPGGQLHRPVVWATALVPLLRQPALDPDIDVTIAVEGSRSRRPSRRARRAPRDPHGQRGVGRAAMEAAGQWSEDAHVPGPTTAPCACPATAPPTRSWSASTFRWPTPRFEELPGPPSRGSLRAVGPHPRRARHVGRHLAILGDYVPFGIGRPSGPWPGATASTTRCRSAGSCPPSGCCSTSASTSSPRLRARRGAPLGGGRHPPRHREPVDDRPVLEGRECRSARTRTRSSLGSRMQRYEGRVALVTGERRASAGHGAPPGGGGRHGRGHRPRRGRAGHHGQGRRPADSVITLTGDVRDPAFAPAAVARALQEGRLDLLVELRRDPALRAQPRGGARELAADPRRDLTGTFLMCQAAIRACWSSAAPS